MQGAYKRLHMKVLEDAEPVLGCGFGVDNEGPVARFGGFSSIAVFARHLISPPHLRGTRHRGAYVVV